MPISRRELIYAGGVSLLLGKRAFTQTATPTPTPQAPPQSQTRLLNALQRNRLPLTLDDSGPAGAGWDRLVEQARAARFTLVGEEHGVAETPRLTAALFGALRGSGYSRMAIELSPPIAYDIEAAARRTGFQGIVDLLTRPDISTFYNLREEAKFVADVIEAGPKDERVLWGLDREIFNDRYLISRLEPKVPKSAQEAFARLKQASANAKTKNEQTKDPDDLFFLAEDPALVSNLRSAWPKADDESAEIMRTMEGSLAIEAAERTGGRWPYSLIRAKWMRDNFVRLVNAGEKHKPPPKILMKFGYNHLIRGLNYVNTFDLGSMADEVAQLTGEQAFHIIVLPSPGSRQAVPGAGRSVGSVATDDFDDFGAGDGRLTRILPNPNATGHEVIDLRALRPYAQRGLESWNSDVVRTIYGYDAAVIWKNGHAATGLEN